MHTLRFVDSSSKLASSLLVSFGFLLALFSLAAAVAVAAGVVAAGFFYSNGFSNPAAPVAAIDAVVAVAVFVSPCAHRRLFWQNCKVSLTAIVSYLPMYMYTYVSVI